MSLAKNIVGALAVLLSSLGQTCGQGTLRITFDGPPPQPPGTATLMQLYEESGVRFSPIPGTDGFVRRGGANQLYPENGTVYLQATLGDSLTFGMYDGSPFGLVSVDLAEYSTVVPDAVTVHFVGYRHDGSIVTTDLTTDGIFDGTGPLADFQTFNFGPQFTGLDRVEIPTYLWSLDNLVVAIPEPSTWALLLVGGALLFVIRRKANS